MGENLKNKEMRALCESHNIKLVHGAPRTPQTQGLVERNNRTVKENLSNIIKEKQADKTEWCNFVEEAAYKKNITVHRATSKSPYEVVFGILPQHQTINQTATTATATSTASGTATAVAEHINLEDVTVEDDEEETNIIMKRKPAHPPTKEKPLKMIWYHEKQQGLQQMKNKNNIMRK